jgi:hypothetical protein
LIGQLARGAGIVTEDGSETANRIEHNFVMRSEGSGQVAEQRNLGKVDFGHEGSGFWFHGVNNYVLDNVSANNGNSGFNFFHLSLPPGLHFPIAQGDDVMVNGQYIVDPVPIKCSRS